MEKRLTAASSGEKKQKKIIKRTSEYGRQLAEKQKVKQMYGVRERQFKKLFDEALKSAGAPGDALLRMLESRLDNVVFRLKMATTRAQARQLIVHGHVRVNGIRVYSPSYLVLPNDTIHIEEKALKKEAFVEQVLDKRMKVGVKVPEWLELDKQHYKGIVLREPVRTDIQATIEDHLIVELYSK
ncbi:MAG TPA: 30S ribosomal protein S4 [Candidatus Babeliales bacterium]|jgi:small subunit ribosomal protein S4|nr:30S ribosomal protein S4 [Candidatus Babeliales bacterium]